MERSSTNTFKLMLTQIFELQKTQNVILQRLSDLETKISPTDSCPISQQSSLYSAMFKVRADTHKTDEKCGRSNGLG